LTGLDTNVLVRFLTRDDEEQFAKAQKLMRDLQVRGESAYISAIVLAELSWVLSASYGFDRAAIASTVESLLQTVEFTVEDRELVNAALEEFRRGKAQLADSLIGARNRAAGCDLTVTFDRGLRGNDAFRVL
jgi:predicted nucleic-acid-binding protein